MNNRERIIHTVLCTKTDRAPFTFYFGPWRETVPRWRTEGLGKDEGWSERFGMDVGFVHADVKLGYVPAFEWRQIEDKGNTMIIVDELGICQEVRKNGSTIPRYIDYPVKGPEDWERLKRERLDPDDPSRFPDNWKALADGYNKGDRVVQLGLYPYGLFGTLRDMMGAEALLYAFFDMPELIHEMMDYLTDFWLTLYAKVCKDVKVDAIHMWEDMSGKQGSLISPAMVREFMAPNYKRIKAFADDHDIPIFSLDTDGDCSQLVPVFMECGINLIFPFEVAAGCDINAYRAHYPNLCIMGGIDKREIAKGREAILRELDRVSAMLEQPGYIPALDHLIPPEISWEDFCFFMERLKQMIGVS